MTGTGLGAAVGTEPDPGAEPGPGPLVGAETAAGAAVGAEAAHGAAAGTESGAGGGCADAGAVAGAEPGPGPGPRPGPGGCAGAGTAGRGRPRSAAVDAAIIEAVLRLLENGVGIDALSIEGIAREARVGKATVYRRWSGKDALLLAVLRSMEEEQIPQPALGRSVRDDLVVILELLRRRGLAKRHSAVLRTVMSHIRSHPRLWREYNDTVIRVRRNTLHGVLRRGIADGELRADLDIELLGELFTGPMLSRAMLHEWHELPEGLAEQIVDAVLEGARPRETRRDGDVRSGDVRGTTGPGPAGPSSGEVNVRVPSQ